MSTCSSPTADAMTTPSLAIITAGNGALSKVACAMNIERHHGVVADAGAAPVPVVEHLARRHVAPVVVVVAGAGQSFGPTADRHNGINGSSGHDRQPRDVVLLLFAEEGVAGFGPPGRHLCAEG